MKFRLVMLFFAALAVASVASATCNVCVASVANKWEGTCQPSFGPMCQGMCCLMDQGNFCDPSERYWGCSAEGIAVPASYFATRLPTLTEGSALRLRLGNGVRPVQKRCSGTSIMTMKLSRTAA
ncbi:MAG TPA: hypothetical protein VGF69_09520 [Thermoanaerobaculia bacterium]|jgi:hypothetical protein